MHTMQTASNNSVKTGRIIESCNFTNGRRLIRADPLKITAQAIIFRCAVQ